MDRRKNKTKKQIKNALVELLNKKDFRKITITDIAEVADINRGTFYLHYLDIYDMIDKIETELIDDIKSIISRHDNELKHNFYYPALFDIAEYVKKDASFYSALTGDNGDMAFMNKIKTSMMETFFQYNQKTNNSDVDILKYAAYFIINGGIGVFLEWVKGGCTLPADKLIKGLEEMFNH